ncbi:winged helix family transcriptional regulator (plasmid) [Mycolicibacterium frederiksbergense]|uniref:Winged helix family transcriptional regulator n=2 Tax=Mycolicibacterium frederiksbergense TaxID=117567 RepID=A0A6H0RWZ4_9MYCO|nr:winged helix family transcriptional regulator [Mycolicibacterium frederiksbergense]
MESVWGSSPTGNAEQVSVHIGALRRRLGDDPDHPALVLNVRGVGYRLAVAYESATTPQCAAAAAAAPP